MKYSTWLLLFGAINTGWTQTLNLVPDPSFEDNLHCPTHFTTIDSPIPLKNWYSPTKATPDLYSGCTVSDAGVPRNWIGESFSVHGNNYAGLYIGIPDNNKYREYLATGLREPLVKDVKYQINLFLKPATYSRFSVDSLQVLLSSDSLLFDHDSVVVSESYISFPIIGEDYDNPMRWNIASFEFVASGGEMFLNIGNFKGSEQVNYTRRNATSKKHVENFAYYYFDYLELISPQHPVLYPLNESFTLRTLYFEFDKSSIVGAAIEELTVLGKFLNDFSNLEIIITGHADSAGSSEYNEKLSLRRANAIRRYLIQSGINKNRMKVVARGEDLSIYEKDSLNRRVEFEIITRDVWGDLNK